MSLENNGTCIFAPMSILCLDVIPCSEAIKIPLVVKLSLSLI